MKVQIEKTSKEIKAGSVLAWVVGVIGLIVAFSDLPVVGAIMILFGICAGIYFRFKRWWEHD